MRAHLRAARRLGSSHERGQVIVIFAVFMIVLMVLAGSAYDYASIVTDDAKLQNAVDAATLAGADALGRNATLPRATVEAMASATAGRFLELNGVAAGQGTTINMAFPTSTPVPPSLTPGPYLDNLSISVTREHLTAFWPLIGINNVSMNSGGSARAARGMVDAWLSLDTTYSMVMTDSMDALRDATKAFINELIPAGVNDPHGPVIGIARFAGTRCDYTRIGTSPAVWGLPYDANTCTDDYQKLIALSHNHSQLIATADSIDHVAWDAPHEPYGYDCDPCPGATGTKIANAISAVYTGASDHAWLSNGRTLGPGAPNPRRVLIIMTDGQNEPLEPMDNDNNSSTPYGGSETKSAYDSLMLTKAQELEAAGIEIFVVGLFCTEGEGYDSTPEGSNERCRSRLAYEPVSTSPRNIYACPASTAPANVAPVDTQLIQLSSSTGSSCDHYFPMDKDDPAGLPSLFQAIAAQISRASLTQ